jgi:hypothetical protein
MAINPIIEYFSRDLVPEYCHELESKAIPSVCPLFVESLHGRSSWSQHHELFHLHGEDIIPIVVTSNIHIGYCHPMARTLT